MEITKRDRRALISGAVALGAIGLYILVIEPVLAAHNNTAATHMALARRVSRAIYENQKAKYDAQQVAEWESNSGKLLEPRPYSEQITTVGSDVVVAAKKGGVQIKHSIWDKPKPWHDNPALALATVRIDAEAPWTNVFKFIAGLYRIPGVLSVERMDLSSGPKKGGKITLKLTLSVMVKADANTEQRWVK